MTHPVVLMQLVWFIVAGSLLVRLTDAEFHLKESAVPGAKFVRVGGAR